MQPRLPRTVAFNAVGVLVGLVALYTVRAEQAKIPG
jgi:hypothetical protein